MAIRLLNENLPYAGGLIHYIATSTTTRGADSLQHNMLSSVPPPDIEGGSSAAFFLTLESSASYRRKPLSHTLTHTLSLSHSHSHTRTHTHSLSSAQLTAADGGWTFVRSCVAENKKKKQKKKD
jgi:hypothetical protein